MFQVSNGTEFAPVGPATTPVLFLDLGRREMWMSTP